jgi:magnesium chelatase subunit H
VSRHDHYCLPPLAFLFSDANEHVVFVIPPSMHGTVEWLPGQPLGNDRTSWADFLVDLPNIYVYAANNPSESILAKRRGYGTIVSYNVPPYGRSGLYLELKNLMELVADFRSISNNSEGASAANVSSAGDLQQAIYATAVRAGMLCDVPLNAIGTSATEAVPAELPDHVDDEKFLVWVTRLSEYLIVLQDRLFSKGLHVLGAKPSEEELRSYLEAYFGEKLTDDAFATVVSKLNAATSSTIAVTPGPGGLMDRLFGWFQNIASGEKSAAVAPPKNSYAGDDDDSDNNSNNSVVDEAMEIVALLHRSTEELDSVMQGLAGGYVRPGLGGDLLRDGKSVLPTGRNIHSLDPYRMPSTAALARGQRAAAEILRQHRAANGSKSYPETVAVTLWGLDTIKTRGESIAIVLSLVGAEPIKEGTGRVVRYDLVPLETLGRPRIDVLASMSGIFRYVITVVVIFRQLTLLCTR